MTSSRPPPGNMNGETDLRQRFNLLKKRQRDPGISVVFVEDHHHHSRHHEPLEVNVVDTSTSGTGGGSCGEGADKSSPSTQGLTTATASPRSLAATTASMTTPSHSPGFIDPDAIMSTTSNDDGDEEETNEGHTSSSYSPENSFDKEDQMNNVVVLRRSNNNINGYRQAILKRNSYSTNEAGRLLKHCLEKHFQEQGNGHEALDEYIQEVFHQLDYHRCGTISRDDFDTLCEVLDLRPLTRPPSTMNGTSHYRLSGLEWLSSYRPRSPLSPLRVDKLNEVKYRGPKRSTTATSQNNTNTEPPNFLFTLGPRPFWEMWPQKRRRKRRLTIDEFKRALLEQWAKSHGIASNRVSFLYAPTSINGTASVTSNGVLHRNHRHIRSVRVQPIPTMVSSTSDSPDTAKNHKPQNGLRSQGLLASIRNGSGQKNHYGHQSSNGPRVHYETRTKRFLRRLARAGRRVHFIRRLSKRIRRESIGPPLQPRIPINPALRQTELIDVTTVHHRRPNITTQQPSVHANVNVERNSLDKQKHRVHLLERQVEHQQTEISGLRDVVQDLRSSLQLSDAQNLALQVLMKKMAKAEAQIPVMGDDSFRSQMDESEKHLENLVKELKEMSQTKYPRYNVPAEASSTTTSINGGADRGITLPDFILEDEVTETYSKVLEGASDELKAATSELQATVTRLQTEDDPISLKEAYRALERAQLELNNMRVQLEEAQAALASTKNELNETKEELFVTQTSLRNSDMQLRDTEKRLSLLSQNRRSLVLELQTTRELLASSLKKVQDLELESRKVPTLENRIHELLERTTTTHHQNSKNKTSSHERGEVHPQVNKPINPGPVHHHHLMHHMPQHLRPLSTVDSGLYSTSDSDHEDNCPSKPHDNSLEGVSEDDDAAFADGILANNSSRSSNRLPPRPRFTKSPRPYTPTIFETKSPSSGHQSAGSKFSVSSPSASPSSMGKCSSPNNIDHPSISSKKSSEEAIAKLRTEITALRERFVSRQKDWAEERNLLLDELLKNRNQESRDLEDLEGERVQLSLLEEKIKEVLHMLRSLNSMNISPKTLGKLVLDSVERSIDPITEEIQVFKFLNHLYHAARDYERISAENMIHSALQAVEAHSQTLAQIEADNFPVRLSDPSQNE